ncbi:DNA ligase-1 [Solimonas aquatica]|uniref:DNA ligase-1 n=1 Tax=Solimonas aquatica TaxID=489703 RepID=A0A1H9KGV7_9GAMM|nr:DNA ligase [Solimonas aquatica]SEQ98157.1 DNA ligase-1 [Solimonas aquatica]
MHRRQVLLQLLALGSLGLSPTAHPQPRGLMLAQVYSKQQPLDFADWWISEKLDGVRACWDGQRLWTRGGHAIAAPDWFTRELPAFSLDGELWAGRGAFERASGIVRNGSDDDAGWRSLRYMIFDLPETAGSFDQRLQTLRSLPLGAAAQAVEQFRLDDANALQARLEAVVAAGGEGLMLHRGASRYVSGRSEDLRKFKPYEDAEALVIATVPGQGRLAGLMGALEVRSDDGRRFRIGSGFSDAQRRKPPAPGSRIRYAYNGLTASGLPRFARYLGLRSDPP